MRGSGEGSNGTWWNGSRLWAPALANLLIGVVAVIPCGCVWWLLTEYPSARCGGDWACNEEASESAFAMTGFALIGGTVVLGLVLVVDVLMPRQEDWRLRNWLGMAALVPVPFAVGRALGWW
ncbi:hypothetical protein [Streptomyces sp. NPDC056883]|uniref:hypothetical protein n=1 Tax=Streptomyces sp. NPDC056883 TaxID=3345959 RepID=UPI00367504D7